MQSNGLKSFSFHQFDDNDNQFQLINESVATRKFNVESKKELNPQMVALKYLESSLNKQSGAFHSFHIPATEEKINIKFEPLNTEYLPLTGNKIVKFRQRINGISVYGSSANIELDGDNNFVSINSSLAGDLNITGAPAISPLQAKKSASVYLLQEIPAQTTPLLYYYYLAEKWRLVYIMKDIYVQPKKESNTEIPGEKGHIHDSPALVNVIVDANEGNVLEVTPAMISFRSQESGADENGQQQIFFASKENDKKILVDEDLQVYTYDNNFNTYFGAGIPGTIVTETISGWNSAGVSAHVNAGKVVVFLKDVLKRNSVDGSGLKILSSINCTRNPWDREWFNAVWLPARNQMAYGQINVQGKLKSLSASLDVVAHEIFHGVTQFTAKLEYHNQSGAMNESYSDIFGMLISNFNIPDINNWNWELGEDINGHPIRNVKDPSLFNQPGHMRDYQILPDNQAGDWGGVHTNSGIHNKTVYLMLTAKNESGLLIFTASEVAQLYYLGLVQLSEKSQFTDSYRSITVAAKSLFRNDPAISQKLMAIDNAFKGVGII